MLTVSVSSLSLLPVKSEFSPGTLFPNVQIYGIFCYRLQSLFYKLDIPFLVSLLPIFFTYPKDTPDMYQTLTWIWFGTFNNNSLFIIKVLKLGAYPVTDA